jgi:hypothetical protein
MEAEVGWGGTDVDVSPASALRTGCASLTFPLRRQKSSVLGLVWGLHQRLVS